MVSQAYTISTVKNAVPPRVKMSQYDSASRTITFTVVDASGATVDLTGKTATVEGTRIDGHAFVANCTVSGSTVTFTETVDMTNAAGDHSAELVIRQSGQRLGTMNFILSVEAAAMDENASITPEDQSLFDQLFGSVDDAIEEVDTAKDAALLEIAQGLASGSPLVANTVAEMTDTDEVYLYTGSESGYTAGSWYYYDGSAWVVGGVYGSGTTDATLSLAGVAADAKATGDAIGDLKNAFNTTVSASTYNWEIGSLNPGYGTPLSSTTRIRSDFIKVTKNTIITLSGEANRLIVYGYNSVKGYIAGSETTWNDGNKFVVPSGTEYVRILIRKSTSNAQISSDDISELVSACSIFMALPNDVNDYPFYIGTLTEGYDWHQLVEINNLSGAYSNATTYKRNGDGISGYVTKIYDITNTRSIRIYGTIYRFYGKKADGTLEPLGTANTTYTGEEYNVNAYYQLAVSSLASNFWGSSYIKVEGFTKIESHWRNRKIVWFGTSIPAGGLKGEDNPLSYPFQVGRRLGATVYNEAVGDSGVHYRELSKVSATNPYGFNFYFISASRCLTNTIAMMQWIGNWADYYCNGGTYKNPEAWDATIFTSGLPSSWTDADTEAIKQFSYENKLDKYLTDSTCPDLFVFDHGYNDRIRWADNTGTYEAQLSEYGRDNCYTFRGAMNFLIDRIYTFKPTAKIIMIGDYEAQSEEKKYDSIYQMKVAEDYEIPIFKRWERTGWSQVQETISATWNSGLLTVSSAASTKTLLAWNLADGVHPHSDKTGGAIRLMTDLITPFIESV